MVLLLNFLVQCGSLPVKRVACTIIRLTLDGLSEEEYLWLQNNLRFLVLQNQLF